MAMILVVDDEELSRQVTEDMVMSFGFKVVCVGDPTKAVEAAEKCRPDLAILDYEMPILSGTLLLGELRRSLGETFPVIFLSGREAISYASQVLPDPHVRFLKKPCDMKALDRMIMELLERGSENS